MIMDIPVQLSVELGRTRLTIKNILQLGQGSVVELDGLAGEPMDIFVNGYLIAKGEVVVVDERYGIRVTDIITPSDRISRIKGRSSTMTEAAVLRLIVSLFFIVALIKIGRAHV